MIIGNNNSNNFNKNIEFQKKLNLDNGTEKKKEKKGFKNIFTKGLSSLGFNNTKNTDEMYDKSLAMLNERLEKGTISLEEFNKKCSAIAKKRNKIK